MEKDKRKHKVMLVNWIGVYIANYVYFLDHKQNFFKQIFKQVFRF